MADEQNTEEEPSIEEILDSIRQIITDDDEEGDGGAPADEEPVVDAAPIDDEPEEDIVELTDRIDEPEDDLEPVEDVVEDEPESEPEPEPTPEPEPEPEPVQIDMQEPEEEPEPIEDLVDFDDSDSEILTDGAERATYDGFEKLVKQTAVEYNGITLEEIVRTELKPLLRDWLDDHLPSMIERLVQEELERISKRVLDD